MAYFDQKRFPHVAAFASLSPAGQQEIIATNMQEGPEKAAELASFKVIDEGIAKIVSERFDGKQR